MWRGAATNESQHRGRKRQTAVAEQVPQAKAFRPMGGASAATVPNTASISAIHASRLRSTRTSNSRRHDAIASVGGTTMLASRACWGANAEARATPIPATKATTTVPVDRGHSLPGRLETYESAFTRGRKLCPRLPRRAGAPRGNAAHSNLRCRTAQPPGEMHP